MTEFARSPCPIAYGLDLFGDRWTLLVLRQVFLGATRFGEFAEMPERIPSNILSDRLRRLVEAGILLRRAYQERPVRYSYHLTAKGADLLPVLQAIARWSRAHEPATWAPPEEFFRKAPADFCED